MSYCPAYYVTTYRQHFQPISRSSYVAHVSKIPQQDEPVITQYFRNTLQVKGLQLKSKVWPKTLFGVEEYKDYLKRLECCKKEIYNSYFQCPSMQTDRIEQMLRDLEKSTYQYVYSPNEFVSRKEARRFAKTADDRTNMKYCDTTYRTYYSRIEELQRFKDVLHSMLCKEEKEKLKNELRKIYKQGVTTYHVDICVPAIEAAKSKPPHNAPIDRFTLRRI